MQSANRTRVARRVTLNRNSVNNNKMSAASNSVNNKTSGTCVANAHRVLCTPNTVVVLHVEQAPIMSIDLCHSKQINTVSNTDIDCNSKKDT